MIHVPFRGSGPAVAALVGNHVAVMFAGLPSVIGNIKSERAAAAGGDEPQADHGAARHADRVRSGPARLRGGAALRADCAGGTTAGHLAKLSAALREALTSDEVKARIDAEGAEPLPSTPEDYVKDIDSEATKWAHVIQQAGISAK